MRSIGRDSSNIYLTCSSHGYVSVKVLTCAFSRETEIYKHLCGLGSSHVGSAYIRGLYDTFNIFGPCGSVHQCLVHPLMHMSIDALRMRARSRRLSEPLLKQTLICVLQALDFLHSEAKVVLSGNSRQSFCG